MQLFSLDATDILSRQVEGIGVISCWEIEYVAGGNCFFGTSRSVEKTVNWDTGYYDSVVKGLHDLPA